MHEYLLNVEVLDICLMSHDEHYQQALKAIEEFNRNYKAVGSKLRRRLATVHILTLKVIYQLYRISIYSIKH